MKAGRCCGSLTTSLPGVRVGLETTQHSQPMGQEQSQSPALLPPFPSSPGSDSQPNSSLEAASPRALTAGAGGSESSLLAGGAEKLNPGSWSPGLCHCAQSGRQARLWGQGRLHTNTPQPSAQMLSCPTGLTFSRGSSFLLCSILPNSSCHCSLEVGVQPNPGVSPET